MNPYLIFASSAPGESLLTLQRSIHETDSDIRHDVVKTRAIVSEIHRNMLKSQDEVDNQRRSVSEICILLHHRMNIWLFPRLKPGQ